MNIPDQTHVLLHDYAGHPFTAELARALAVKGMRITYVYFDGDRGPKGRNAKLEGDPENFVSVALGIDAAYSKSNFFKRRQGDIAYGKRLAALVNDVKPDIVLSGNTPTECQEYLVRACARTNSHFVYWCQDFYSIAALRILSKKIPVFGYAIGAYYTFLERRQMRRAAHVIHITDAFLKVTDRWGISSKRVSVIPNWGVIDEIPVLPRDTEWGVRVGLKRPHRIIYSGTLANKHNPEFLARLAREGGSDLDVVIVGFGVGAELLEQQSHKLPNLTVLPLQPFAEFPQVLASADVLVAVIESDAGEFSVPSKVLSYLCAGRPIVLASPPENLAAKIIRDAGAGIVVDPADYAGFVRAVTNLLSSPDLRRGMGTNARSFAERNFVMDSIVARFECIFADLVAKPLEDSLSNSERI